MAIKKLQNNFTTPEQSKILLELGVPSDSADLQIPYIEYYNLSPSDNEKIIQYYEYLAPIFWDETEHGLLPKDKVVWEREFSGEKYDGHTTEYLPCWSVGRLIEIYELCVGEKFERRANPSTLQLMPIMEDILEQYQIRIESIYRHMDFSKLD